MVVEDKYLQKYYQDLLTGGHQGYAPRVAMKFRLQLDNRWLFFRMNIFSGMTEMSSAQGAHLPQETMHSSQSPQKKTLYSFFFPFHLVCLRKVAM